MQRQSLALIGLLLLAAALFLINLGGYDLWPPDEPRFAQIAREMLQSRDFIVPHINNEVYSEKPPMLMWAIAAVSAPFGDVSEWTARFPSVVSALVTVLFTYLLARRLYGPRVAIWSGLVLTTMALFWWEARSVRTDMMLTACLTVCLYAFWRWHRERSAGMLVLFYTALAVALLVKGPPAIVFTTLLVFAFYWNQKHERIQFHYFIGLTVAAVPVLIWLTLKHFQAPAVAEGDVAIGDNLFRQTIGRFFLGVSHAQWPWYYFINLPINWLPWSLLLPWTLPWVWKKRHEDERMRLLLAWMIPAFIFFTLCIGKRPVYLIPIYPVAAILFARSALELAKSSRKRLQQNIEISWMLPLAIVPVACLVVLGSSYYSDIVPFMRPIADRSENIMMEITLFGLIVSAMGVAWDMTRGRRRVSNEAGGPHKVFALTSAPLLALVALLFFPALDEHKGAKDFCAPLRQLSEKQVDYRLYSVGVSREEYVFYSKHAHVPVLMDLLPIPQQPGMKPMDMVKLQRTLRKRIAKAVESHPIDAGVALTDQDLLALRAVVHESVVDAKIDPVLTSEFEKALGDTLNAFADTMLDPRPAFFFVQEEDWRWILPLCPRLHALTVLKYAPVGSRKMLIVANDAGDRAMNP